jgi:transcriptional regulator with XRE-family HTH domain
MSDKGFGERVKAQRINKGLSQQLLADLCGVSRATLINIEQGNHKVGLSTAISLANHLSLNLATLQGKDQRKKAKQKVDTLMRLEAKKQALRQEIKGLIDTTA